MPRFRFTGTGFRRLAVPGADQARCFGLTALLMLPWLSYAAGGPLPSLHQSLVTIFVAGAAAFLWPPHHIPGIVASRAWMYAALVSACMALVQYAGHASRLDPWVSQAAAGEAFANLRQRNQFASLCNIGLAALIFRASALRARWWIGLPVLAAGLLAVANAVSASRTGATQLLMLCLLYLLWGTARPRNALAVLASAVVGYLAVVLLVPLWGADASAGLMARLAAGDEVCASRLTLWSNVLHLIAQKPWFGWGWGELDYAHYITLYDGPRFCDILDNAHNLPLHLAVELGLPVAILVCVGFLWWVVRRKPWAETDATRQMAWAVMAVILLHSMLEYPLWYGPFQMAFALCILLLWRRAPDDAASPGPESVRHGGRWYLYRLISGLLMLSGGAYTAWDYHRISQLYLPPAERSAAYRGDTLEKVRGSWLFHQQVVFAELSTTPLTRANAQWTYDTSRSLLHFSPEPRVIGKVIESAVMLGRDDEAVAHLARFRAAFPGEYAKWSRAQGGTSSGS